MRWCLWVVCGCGSLPPSIVGPNGSGDGTDGVIGRPGTDSDPAPGITVTRDTASPGGPPPHTGILTATGHSGAPAPFVPPLVAAPDPGPPVFPGTIDRLTVTVVTGEGADAATDSGGLSLCLTEASCHPLGLAAVNDFEAGAVDIYHFADVGLPRADVDRIELRSEGGLDPWEPACLAVAFDGEPVYCNDDLDVALGAPGSGVVGSWADPLGVHAACDGCTPRLTHGPIRGHTTSSTARVWVRTDATRTVALKVSSSPDPDAAVVVDWLLPSPETDFTGSLVVDGLVPDHPYLWWVEVDGEASPERTLYAAPPPEAPGTFRVVFGSCTKYEDQPIFEVIQEQDPDLFVFLGDTHYGDAVDVDSARYWFRWGHSRPERAEMMTRLPVLAIWDDHDFLGGNSFASSPGREAVLQAFKEYWPNASAGAPGVEGAFHRATWGQLELFLIDCRYWRGIDGGFLGPGQTDWLVEAVTSSEAVFKLLACGSPWTDRGGADSWSPFLSERDALFDALAEVSGLILFSGDMHRSEVRWLPRGDRYDLPEVITSPLAAGTGSCGTDSQVVSGTCYEWGNNFVELEADTTLADPEVVVRIRRKSGSVHKEVDFKLSDLTP